MEEIAFSDWPGQDLSGSNPWQPAYGYQQPQTLLDKDDFLGNPDADLFLYGGNSQYACLETIQEETSDDLRSESDVSETRATPVGWLATDSDSGSVIQRQTIEDGDCESDREAACPAKRRKQDHHLHVSDDDSSQSLSRSSSLLQFESLEKQCQDVSSSSPSIFSTFSFDSLERKGNVSPDSLERDEGESDYYKTLKIDVPCKKREKSRDSLFYNNSTHSDSGESGDSEETLEATRYDSSKSVNIKTWRSFDGLHVNHNVVQSRTVKISAENLSEDSGYSDNFYKSSSIPNMVVVQHEKVFPEKNVYKTRVQIGEGRVSGFEAYDGDVFHSFSGNFGVSYHDLSVVDEYRSPLIDRFMRNGAAKRRVDSVNIDAAECVRPTKYSTPSASEPNLLESGEDRCAAGVDSEQSRSGVCVSSVPKDLNLAGDLKCTEDVWTINFAKDGGSIAEKNWDLTMPKLSRYHRAEYGDKITIRLKYDTSSLSSASDVDGATSFKREGSYLEAMSNSIDMSDEESKARQRRSVFDHEMLKAISETSVQSFGKSIEKLDAAFVSTPISKQNRNVISTPNLTEVIPRKSSLINRSTSTSGVSDADDRTLTSARSFGGSSGSKGVHFCPVVAEVNWRDDSLSTERESSYSLSSTPEREVKPPTPPLIRPEPRKPARISASQPELQAFKNNNTTTTIDNVDDDSSSDDSAELKFSPSIKSSVSQPEFVPRNAPSPKSSTSYRSESHLAANVYHSPTRQQSHVSAGACNKSSDNKSKPVVAAAMETHRGSTKTAKPAASRLGGFFSRIASFRFSRKGDEKAKSKKKFVEQPANEQPTTGQRLATKDDYIYIPLKGPSNNNHQISKVQVDGRAISDCVSAKPPLPKMPPPRVVGACVKKRPETSAVSARVPSGPERRTIDSGPHRPMEPMGLIETDLDTEVTVITGHGVNAKTRSLMNLGVEAPTTITTTTTPRLVAPAHHHHTGRPHKSMEFLLDKQNLKVVEPPENELQKGGERVMSEHQLRVQRSLQKLNVPDWYKQAQVPREGFLLKKTPTSRESRWQGTGSKTTSLSSLGSNAHSPIVLSPTTLHSQPFVRWSTSKLNSTASSPCASTRSSFNARQPNGSVSPSSLRGSFSYRQPYMGWRSQERLSRPRTPAERLANSILSQTPAAAPPQESPEIQTSIKEVTSAIVHYVSGLRPDAGRERSYDSQETASQRSRSVSPRGSQRLCWLESSFVGTRPLDSPQTPITLTESPAPIPPTSLRLDLQTHNGESVHA